MLKIKPGICSLHPFSFPEVQKSGCYCRLRFLYILLTTDHCNLCERDLPCPWVITGNWNSSTLLEFSICSAIFFVSPFWQPTLTWTSRNVALNYKCHFCSSNSTKWLSFQSTRRLVWDQTKLIRMYEFCSLQLSPSVMLNIPKYFVK